MCDACAQITPSDYLPYLPSTEHVYAPDRQFLGWVWLQYSDTYPSWNYMEPSGLHGSGGGCAADDGREYAFGELAKWGRVTRLSETQAGRRLLRLEGIEHDIARLQADRERIEQRPDWDSR